jgi:hypothetical protein
METFTLKIGRYEWTGYFVADRYYNDSTIALSFMDAEEHDPIATITTQKNFSLHGLDKDRTILIKDYSENAGVRQSMIDNGLIEPEPIKIIASEWVELYAHTITNKLYELIKDQI